MKYHGIAVSKGISIARAFKLDPKQLKIPTHTITNYQEEEQLLKKAIDKSSEEITTLFHQTKEKLDEEHAMIFNAHLSILHDPEILNQTKKRMLDEQENVVHAYYNVCSNFQNIFAQMDDEYMKERALDIKDVSTRVISHLLGENNTSLSSLAEEVIIVAKDITPSDTAQMNKQYVKGFITELGGKTSHSAIIARSLEIPAVVGINGIYDNIKNGDVIIINGLNGDVYVNPTTKEQNDYELLQKEYLQKIKERQKLKEKPSITKDGKKIEIAANIASVEDIKLATANGADGIGLFRTEFLYMNNKSLPSEEKQFEVYKTVLQKMVNKKVIIRTLDIGGDKELSYLNLPKEMNPFLGVRALRFCLKNKDLFTTQLRALLRASVYGNLHIMFPMVATIEELLEAKDLLNKCHQDLLDEGKEVNPNYKVGIMVEIPSVAILAEQFTKHVDFFSIGSNDLIQYTFAADRMNQDVAYLYQIYHPSLLKLIKQVIDAAHKDNKWVGMCGEMASDPLAATILLGMGLDEFSMNATSILEIKDLFQKINQSDLIPLTDKLLQMSTNKEVKNYIENWLKEKDHD